LRWVTGAADDPADICAHGDVEFRIGDDVLLDATTGRDVTVSAAALYLLRTLSVPHSNDSPVGDHLFPHCGHSIFDVPGQEDVLILGCPSGVDFEVLHEVSGAGVVIRSEEGRQWRVGWPDWRLAVFGFADWVAAFYADCSPKQPSEGDAAGYRKFKDEWKRRRGQEFDLGSRSI
jgi:hypothetical protein